VESEKKIRTLVVEDNPTQANMLRISLTRRGFEVEAVAYLAHAVERLEKGQIDVILLDLSLPDSDGIQTFYELYNRAPEVPIVVLSGLNDQAVAQSALEGGAQDYLVKGIPSDESISRCLRYAIERHRFERKIWESERITRLIVENAHDAFISMDGAGLVTGWNLKAESIFGWYRKDAIGKPITELIMPVEMRAFFNQEVRAFLHGQRGSLVNNRVETMLLRKDGTRFSAELAMFPVTIGSSYTLCGFVQDISDRKRVEARLHEINQNLEGLVSERTSQLEESNRQLLQFAKQASRQLQEPLVSLQSLALDLSKKLRDLHDDSIEESIDNILECSTAMMSAVHALADHGRSFKPGAAPSQPDRTKPPISQISLPDQMVPTSNVSAATAISPQPYRQAAITSVLPAMERPGVSAKRQEAPQPASASSPAELPNAGENSAGGA
jgi:PAS domain S-box-containing protein